MAYKTKLKLVRKTTPVVADAKLKPVKKLKGSGRIVKKLKDSNGQRSHGERGLKLGHVKNELRNRAEGSAIGKAKRAGRGNPVVPRMAFSAPMQPKSTKGSAATNAPHPASGKTISAPSSSFPARPPATKPPIRQGGGSAGVKAGRVPAAAASYAGRHTPPARGARAQVAAGAKRMPPGLSKRLPVQPPGADTGKSGGSAAPTGSRPTGQYKRIGAGAVGTGAQLPANGLGRKKPVTPRPSGASRRISGY